MNGSHDSPSVVFESDDMDLFAAASLDRNPLHLSDAYARESPYGRRVAFGVLGALTAMARLPDRQPSSLGSVTIDFLRPIFLSTRYTIEVDAEGDEVAKIRLRDGSQVLLRVLLRFRSTSPAQTARFELGHGPMGLVEALDLQRADLVAGRRVVGEYAPAGAALASLRDRYRLIAKGIDDKALLSMVFASYVVGMELPGRRALFTHLHLDFSEGGSGSRGPIGFCAEIADMDERFDLVSMRVRLTGDERLAEGELRAFYRGNAPAPDRARIETLLQPGRQLEGKVAIVIGGSRGLGASIALALAIRGAQVVLVYQKSLSAALRVQRASEGTSGSIELVALDATDADATATLRRRLFAEHRRLDFLICNASPAIMALPLESATAERISAFIASAVSQVTVPLATFLDLLSAHRGIGVVVSSSLVRDPSPELAHYVSAKAAVEMLARVASRRTPFLILRPPKLLTDSTNTPLGREGAIGVEAIAAALVRRLEGCAPVGMEVVEDFGTGEANPVEAPHAS